MLVAYAQFHGPQIAEQRQSFRRKLTLNSEAAVGNKGYRILIHDLSENGMMFEAAAGLAMDGLLELELPETGPVLARVVWNDGYRYGCEFQSRLSKASVSASTLISPFKIRPELKCEERQSISLSLADQLDQLQWKYSGMANYALYSLLAASTLFAFILAKSTFSVGL